MSKVAPCFIPVIGILSKEFEHLLSIVYFKEFIKINRKWKHLDQTTCLRNKWFKKQLRCRSNQVFIKAQRNLVVTNVLFEMCEPYGESSAKRKKPSCSKDGGIPVSS